MTNGFCDFCKKKLGWKEKIFNAIGVDISEDRDYEDYVELEICDLCKKENKEKIKSYIEMKKQEVKAKTQKEKEKDRKRTEVVKEIKNIEMLK